MGMRPALALAAGCSSDIDSQIRRRITWSSSTPGTRVHTQPRSTPPGLWISAYCSHQHIGESEADAARQFPPPAMSLGLPLKQATRSIFLRIPIRFGKWKLAQEGSPLARKRSAMNILAASRCFSAGALPSACAASVPWGRAPTGT